MRKPAISLRIPTPCAQPWDAMTPQGAGRHCASCQKVVIDFTRKTDAEILAILVGASGSTCGRLRGSQLGRALRQPDSGRAGWWSTAVAATVALLVGRSGAAPEARAQAPTHQHPNFGRHSPEPELRQVMPPGGIVKGGLQEVTVADTLLRTQVSGQVVDEQGQGLPGVTVLLQGTQHGVSTDSDGHFSLAVQPQEQQCLLGFHSIGYDSRMMPLPPAGQVIVLKMDTRQLGGLMVVEVAPIYTPRGLWYRLRGIPYRVANLLR